MTNSPIQPGFYRPLSKVLCAAICWSNLVWMLSLSPTLSLSLMAQNESAEVKPITFDDIKLDIEAGDDYDESLLTDEIKQLNKVKVQLRGFMLPSTKQDGVKAFILVRDNQECCFGPNAAIHDCVVVKLKNGNETSFTVRPVTVEGTFLLKEYRPGRKGSRPLAIYRMLDCQVTH